MATTTKPKSKIPPFVSHEEATVSMFREDPELAAEYLNQVLADGDHRELLVAMRYLASAFGGVAGVAAATKLNARTLYRTLSAAGNPELDTFTALLKAMGMRIFVAPIKSAAKPTRRRAAERAA
jgi:probable addiction module antidote protein